MEQLKNMSGIKGTIEMEKILDAPVAKVWEAFTNQEKAKKWYFDMKDFKPVTGQEFGFEGGDPNDKIFVHLCKVLEIVPERKFVHTWSYKGYEGESVLSFEFVPQGNQTRLKLKHSGLDSFPAIDSFALKNFEMGWGDIIGNGLPAFLEKE